MKIAEDITKLVGRTPLVRLNAIADQSVARIIAKLEFFNPCSSVKDRIAVAMLETAQAQGLLREDAVIIEATSGNTGIGLAFVCAVKKYRLILVIPESMSLERRKIFKNLGAEIFLTPAEQAMQGAVNKAEQLAEAIPNAFMPMQFKNKANPLVHKLTTGEEIWADTDGGVDVFVCGIGTGGTISGVGETLKKKNSEIKIIGVEPLNCAVLSGGTQGEHKIQGIGAGFVPEVLNQGIIDQIVKVSDNCAIETARDLAKQEGILAGISSGAAVFASLEIGRREENKGKMIVTLLPDTGERYLSTELFE
ncbi:MAG: cysteine synthase A [Candidatus Omnitrophota bacterium]|nr:MAG: cysteine synthase A [Candidatus Omnitrophota bacterium]